jgi:hypothetical protein
MKAIFAKGTATLAEAFTLLVLLAAVADYVVNVAGAQPASSTRLVIISAGWAITGLFAVVVLGAAGRKTI